MKNIRFIAIFTMICMSGFHSKAETIDRYVLVNLNIDLRDETINYPQLAVLGGFTSLRKDGVYSSEINYLSKDECKKQIGENTKETKRIFSEAAKESKFNFQKVENSVITDSYVVDMLNALGFLDNYFCIPSEMWNEMESAVSPETYDRFKKGDDDRFKSEKSFFNIMKKCGLIDFNYNHINLAETPFICDKYSEKNPVPYQPFEAVIKMKK